MNELKVNKNIFESIKHIDEFGMEFWYARELQKVLDYKRWDKFTNVINDAVIVCEQSNCIIDDHFSQVGKMINLAKNARREIDDYKLSRYACYLIAQNADPRKEVVALAQTYFAIQTRKMELTEIEYEKLSEDEKRLFNRALTKKVIIHLIKQLRKLELRIFQNFIMLVTKDYTMEKLPMILLKEKAYVIEKKY